MLILFVFVAIGNKLGSGSH